MRTAIAVPLLCAICLLLCTITAAQTPAVVPRIGTVMESAKKPPAFRTRFDRKIVPGQPVLVCTRVDRGPVIDGEVDREPVWASCGRTHGAWTQIGRHRESGRQTVVYSCYDKENLYFAFVCEESELQNVRMDGRLTQSFQSAGPDDSAEAIIEVGGLQGDGEVYSFRANSRARMSAWGLTGIPPDKGYHIPEWRSAGKFGPNRWMVEMAIPFAAIKKRPAQNGLATPSRGDVWGLKLLRWGAQQQDTKDRMISTWNTDIDFPYAYIAGFNGLLYFDDSNSLRDGTFTIAANDSPWERKGQVEVLPAGGVSLGKGASLSQSVEVRANCLYLLSLEGDGTPDLLMDGKKLALKNGQAGYWSGRQQDKATVTLEAAEPARVKKVLMEYQPGEEPAGTYCLTNNYRHASRNIRSIMPNAPEGRYQYLKLDFQNRVVGDDNPAIPVNYWAFDRSTHINDLGGRHGWIPFSKGSLTGKPEVILWNCILLDEPSYTYGVKVNQVLELDLGQEYYVRGLDVLWLAPNTCNFEVWGKVKAEDEWMLLHMDDGPFVEPSKRKNDYRTYESVRGLDSTVRYVRWRNTQQPRWSKCIDGIQEMWVWGEPKGEHAGIKPFQPWILNEGVPAVKWTTTAPDPDACQIVPRPRKMEKGEGWFVISPGTKIVAQSDVEARKVARQIREEIRERWQIEVPVAEEPADAAEKLNDVIYVGRPVMGALAERLRKEEGLEIPAKPQAYALRVSPRGMVVLGGDDEGLYWGVQSLMLAMRWHSSKDPKQNGLGVRCMKVEDWPATLDRSLLFTEGTLFGYVPSEIPRLLRNCQLQSRFKWNATYTAIEGPALSWPTGLVATVSQQIRDQYHMEIRPMLLGHPRCSLCGWDKLVRASKDYSVVECNPDEAPEELGSALNLCPVNPRSYDLIFAKIDELRELCGRPGKIWLGGLALHGHQSGSRWAICRNCQKSGKSKDELFALFAEKIARHLRERQMTGVLEPWNVAFGDRDDVRWKRAIVAADVKSLPGDLEYILPDDGSPRFREFIESKLLPSRTANGPLDWPSVERINLDGMATDLGTATHLTDTPWWAGHPSAVERMWYGADKRPREKIDFQDLRVLGNSFHFRRDFPSWRAGDRPNFFPIDIRPFVNHTGQATGRETLEPGRMPAIDLRYVAKGKQVLSGVEFDIIDPAKNNGKSILTLGRPAPSKTHPKDAATVIEGAGPILVGRKLASLAFLRASWQASPQWQCWDAWLFPACRVTYDDSTWSLVDCFRQWAPKEFWNNPDDSSREVPLLDRIGWKGNCPGGSGVMLKVNEWVNPYPSKVIKSLEFFTPAYEQGDGRKMVNSQCQAFIAITGVEPIEQDFNYWSKRADRPPLLPPLKAPARPGVVLQRGGAVGGANTRYAVTLKGPGGETKSKLELTPGARWAREGGTRAHGFSRNDCGQVGCMTGYRPFGVVQVLEPAVNLCRVEVRGPTCGYYHNYYTLGRNHRLDVTLEISEDGETWRKVGELRGILGDADFLPMEFDPVSVRKLRFTATAQPYHEDYSPAVVTIDYPYFVWRLIAPAEGGEGKK